MSKNPKDTVVVPPGHRVVIIYPSPDPFFLPSESGPMMLNFGSVDYVSTALTKVAEWVGSTTEQQSVVWLMPSNILPAFENAPALLDQVANLVNAAPHISHLAVFPGSSPLLERVMESLRGVGVTTQRGAPDGGCYVEVHKPDGSIVVGIPGPDSPVDEVARPRDFDTLVIDVADHKRDEDFLELINRLPALRVTISAVGPLPEGLRHKEGVTLKEPLECISGSVEGLNCLIAFTSRVDPRLDPERVFTVDGLAALQMVLDSGFGGLLIQSSGTAWVVIERKVIEEILSPRSEPSLMDAVKRSFARIFSKPKRT